MRVNGLIGLLAAFALAASACSSEPVDTSSTTIPARPTSSAATSTTVAVATTTTISDIEVVGIGVAETLDLVIVDPESAALDGGILRYADTSVGLPDGATIDFDPETLVVSGDVAEVLALVTLPDGQVDRFGVVLVPDGDIWLIAYTVLLP